MEVLTTTSVTYFVEIMFMRQIILTGIWAILCSVVINLTVFSELTIRTYSFLFELLFVITLLILRSYAREMVRRKVHNKEKMIDVEIKRTNDLLGNLVPPLVLLGIKGDQKVVDELDDVTLLFTDMVGFANFSNKVKNPKDVVNLLSDLFTRFDQLCVNNQVYKVHTIGDCYVILGYTGHIPCT